MMTITDRAWRRWIGVLLATCAGQWSCSANTSSQLDEEERQWVVEDRLVPPTGGPMSAAVGPMTPLRAQARPQAATRVVPAPRPVKPAAWSVEEAPAAPAAAIDSAPIVHPSAPVVPEPVAIAADESAQDAGSLGGSHAEQVRVSLYPSTIITCDGALEVDYDHSKAVFHDNVHVTDERGELFADIMEVYFSKTREIEQVIAIGNVRIVRGDDTAYSDRAVYLQKEGRVFLTGQPKLVLFPDTGDSLVGGPSH